MDLRRIRHFVVLAETLNVSRAAERLHMAQPPLSVSIQKLETELGFKLFNRTSTGVTLTASGAAALVEARNLLQHGAQLARIGEDAAKGTGGRLHVGFVGSAIYSPLPRLVPAFRSEFPGVELVLSEATSARILEQLTENAIDIGLVRTPLLKGTPATLVTLREDAFVAALSPDHPLSRAPTLALADLAAEPFIMYSHADAPGLHGAAMFACQRAGFMPHVTQEAVQIQTVLALVESGLGVALVPSVMERFQTGRIVYRKLEGLSPESGTALALAYNAGRETPAGRHFRELAVRLAAA